MELHPRILPRASKIFPSAEPRNLCYSPFDTPTTAMIPTTPILAPRASSTPRPALREGRRLVSTSCAGSSARLWQQQQQEQEQHPRHTYSHNRHNVPSPALSNSLSDAYCDPATPPTHHPTPPYCLASASYVGDPAGCVTGFQPIDFGQYTPPLDPVDGSCAQVLPEQLPPVLRLLEAMLQYQATADPDPRPHHGRALSHSPDDPRALFEEAYNYFEDIVHCVLHIGTGDETRSDEPVGGGDMGENDSLITVKIEDQGQVEHEHYNLPAAPGPPHCASSLHTLAGRILNASDGEVLAPASGGAAVSIQALPSGCAQTPARAACSGDFDLHEFFCRTATPSLSRTPSPVHDDSGPTGCTIIKGPL